MHNHGVVKRIDEGLLLAEAVEAYYLFGLL